jgi:hypothetical protein
VALVITEATITCPQCGHAAVESMPTDACVLAYRCEACQAVLRPLAGTCCVFCSHAEVPCPPKQLAA